MQPFEKTPDAVTGRRISAVDYAKTLAIVCVVMIHVSSEVLLGRQIGSAAWLEGLFWSSLARGAVPMFLMCSGVLFMDRSGGLSVRHIWNRNLRKRVQFVPLRREPKRCLHKRNSLLCKSLCASMQCL